MKKKQKGKSGDRLLPLLPLVQTFLIAGGVIVLFMVEIGIIVFARKLGWFFVPILLLYNACIIAVTYQVLRRRELNNVRAIAGDEVFFATYPREAKRIARKKKREECLQEKEKQRQQREKWL